MASTVLETAGTPDAGRGSAALLYADPERLAGESAPWPTDELAQCAKVAAAAAGKMQESTVIFRQIMMTFPHGVTDTRRLSQAYAWNEKYKLF